MKPRTVFVMAMLVTKLPSDAITLTLGRLLGNVFQSFEMKRMPATEAPWAAQGFEVCMVGLVVMSNEDPNAMLSRAEGFADHPGNVGIELQLVVIAPAEAEAFWREVQGDDQAINAACGKMAMAHPWEMKGEKLGPSVAFNAPRGDA